MSAGTLAARSVGAPAVPTVRPAVAVLPVVACVAVMVAASVALQLVGVGPEPHQPLDHLWFWADTPWSVARVGDGTARVLGRVALLALGLAWLGLGALVARGHAGARTVLVAAVLTALPMAVGPPLFSDDVYHYAAVGAMVRHGLDPYVVGPAALGGAPIAAEVNGFWAATPSPYGPLLLDLGWFVDLVTGERLLPAVIAFRTLAVLALAGSVLLLARAAPPARRPALLWLLAANPLVLVSVVSAAHNDVLLLLAVAGAVLLLARGRPLLAMGLAGLSGEIKVTGLVVAAVLVGWHAWGALGLRARVLRVLRAGGVAAGALALTGVLAGRGFGWVHNLDVPQKAFQLITPVDALADLVGRATGGSYPVPQLRTAGQVLSLAALAACAVLARRLGAARAAGLALLAVVALGPVVWPWYVLVGVGLLALGGSRIEHAVLAVWSVLLLLPVLPGATPVLGRPPLTPLQADALTLLVTGAGVLAVLAQALPRLNRDRSGAAARGS